MTKVVIIKSKNDYKGFEVKGHACFNTGGPDILCSAISMASQMTANGIVDVAGVKIDVEEGDGSLSVKLVDKPNTISNALIYSFENAITNLHEQYPEFMTLTRVDWSE